ncbi:hypothetical protein FB45DRAFT_1061211 [Roridomyces roridus]|uniref:Dystroglycan-type cadherin-like domain-containing protein n=1 Tax=Roridomyces roridus TaxID=1738132 RepID=A0AAD7FJV0_9AGAR|nr:hypothetical protein FB45DRAFT_1061211 [Roridomyces roridus]
MLLPFFYLLALAWAISASTLTLDIPIDQQLPRICRVNEPCSWSFSPSTFRSTAGEIAYSVSSLPRWLAFDPSTLTFHGAPAADDQGNPVITVTAHDPASSLSSTFTFCVTPYPPPTLNTSLAIQFSSPSPALSSVFILSLNSALSTSNPALRIPPSWSFSIGILFYTYTAEHDLFYDVRQANGSEVPEWMEFNQKDLTLNGVVPSDRVLQSPYIISLVLHTSDQEGYTAYMDPFDLVIAPDELYQLQSLPAINITDDTPFNFSLSSRDDFNGIFVDKQGIDPTNITSLFIDTSSSDWLKFDGANRMLSGNPPANSQGQRFVFPLTLATSFNQSLQTNVSIAILTSYFSSAQLPDQNVGPDGQINLNISPDFSNATSDQAADVTLSATLDPVESSNWLSFDPTGATLSGTVPEDFSNSRIGVTFTAYSHSSHTSSHMSVTFFLPNSSSKGKKAFGHPSNLSAAAHRKLVLSLGIVFGLIGGVCGLGAIFSVFGRCLRAEDTARTDEEGRNVWSESEKRWYGVDEEKGYGFSMPRPAMDLENPFGLGGELMTPVRGGQDYGPLGLGLRRVAERSGSDPVSNGPGSPQSPGVMRKGEFLTRIRQTVRNVSDKYNPLRKASSERPVISKPTLLVPGNGHLSFDVQASASPNPFDDPHNIASYPGSTVMTNSPSTSTGERSIPRRRADFAPPKAPAAAHLSDGLVRQLSSGSLSSNEEEAVIQLPPAERDPVWCRLRAPLVFRFQPSGSSGSRRVPSQKAVVLKNGVDKSPTADDLSMGIHYVRSLGGDPSTPTVSSNHRSSFSSLESSHEGHAAVGSVMRTLVRAGEKFKFRVDVSLYSAASYTKPRKLEAKLMSGKPLPKFLHVDLNGNKHAGAVEFYGAPGARDLGEFNVGVYTVDDGACVGRVIVGVVSASR